MNYQGTQTVALRVYFYPILDFFKREKFEKSSIKININHHFVLSVTNN